ncbi:hypothetical protein BD408DRAFT_419871 [Parasitella parasitica]|nr:hypothetical protein BD408DRAFT_419871 [Parasitella parasitica]
MKNALRITSAVALFITVAFLFAHFVYKPKETIIETTPLIIDTKQPNVKASEHEKFMSFFPHGDFASQHEAVRNAFRIALETNRTLILPQVRLGTKDIPWAPYTILQKYYESQDKELLKATCLLDKKDWRTEFQPCGDLNQWIELPWSSFFNLKELNTRFGIRVLERKWGHGWGMHEPMLSHLKLTQHDIVAVDPTSFPSNGSDWDIQDQQKVINRGSWSNLFTNSGQRNEVEASTKLATPLKTLVTSDKLLQIEERYIQFGSLVFGLRYQTKISKKQTKLQVALRSKVFTSPNQFNQINLVAEKITSKLGGSGIYNVMHMNLGDVTKTELVNQISMAREIAEIEGTAFVNHLKLEHADGVPYSPEELLQQLDHSAQNELMLSLVRELEGDMPIHQALSAALPFQKSKLKDLTQQDQTKRSEMLLACIEYVKTVDNSYPIYYLTNDVYSDIDAHPEFFGPLVKAFPCTFTPVDMYNWGVIKKGWTSGIPELNDPDVDYEAMLSPIIEILVARQGYSFFEVPNTKLTRLLSWH